MAKARLCSRQTCTREAVYTLTYAYSESTAVVGPLSNVREPHAYDLCEFHASRLTAPQGWDVVRVGGAPKAEAGEEHQSQMSQPAYPRLRSVD
ncbi:DUF3499 family protein [Rothia aerolata]|uniref:DUF3499 domain-containing protein n=1 Tax=Rothia aerolata TaxID=1812262 RepID=A0A917IS56_9MICC|nr:DUF3499 family protein [Rothia aerolata]GGH62861.1 hypothetical protein GCM10007359_13530 [Rothia aerolata]